jgi:hypothetical protein
MTGTNCDLFTHNQSRAYLNHLVYVRTYGELCNQFGSQAVLNTVQLFVYLHRATSVQTDRSEHSSVVRVLAPRYVRTDRPF